MGKQKITLDISDDLIEDLDSYADVRARGNRSEAIRNLIKIGLSLAETAFYAENKIVNQSLKQEISEVEPTDEGTYRLPDGEEVEDFEQPLERSAEKTHEDISSLVNRIVQEHFDWPGREVRKNRCPVCDSDKSEWEKPGYLAQHIFRKKDSRHKQFCLYLERFYGVQSLEEIKEWIKEEKEKSMPMYDGTKIEEFSF